MIAGAAVAAQRLLRRRGKQQLQLALARQIVIEVGRQQRAGRITLAAHLPVAARFDQQPFPMRVQLGVGRDIDFFCRPSCISRK